MKTLSICKGCEVVPCACNEKLDHIPLEMF